MEGQILARHTDWLIYRKDAAVCLLTPGDSLLPLQREVWKDSILLPIVCSLLNTRLYLSIALSSPHLGQTLRSS